MDSVGKGRHCLFTAPWRWNSMLSFKLPLKASGRVLPIIAGLRWEYKPPLASAALSSMVACQEPHDCSPGSLHWHDQRVDCLLLGGGESPNSPLGLPWYQSTRRRHNITSEWEVKVQASFPLGLHKHHGKRHHYCSVRVNIPPAHSVIPSQQSGMVSQSVCVCVCVCVCVSFGWSRAVIFRKFSALLYSPFPVSLTKESGFFLSPFFDLPLLVFLGCWLLQHPVLAIWGTKKIQGYTAISFLWFQHP